MELPNNEIHLYFSFPGQISDPELLEQYKSLLTDDELTRMSRLYYARHRHEYLITRALIRTSLSKYFEVEPADWRFGKNGYGKPEISFPDKPWPIRFNLSHCNGLIMCGMARDDDIGVDVEDAQRSTRAAFDSLSSYFSNEEIADMSGLPPDQQKQRFFDYWTLKEARVKASGEALALALNSSSFELSFPVSGGIGAIATRASDSATTVQYLLWDLPAGFRLAVCRISDLALPPCLRLLELREEGVAAEFEASLRGTSIQH